MNNNRKNNKGKGPKKSLIFYYIAILIIAYLINTFFIRDMVAKPPVKKVTYDAFLKAIDVGVVDKVQKMGGNIVFQLKPDYIAVHDEKSGKYKFEKLETKNKAKDKTNETNKDKLENALRPQEEPVRVFITGEWDYAGLTEKLEAKGVHFGSEIIEKPSIFMSILGFLLPIVTFIIMALILSKILFKDMGGGLDKFGFGKSGAKVYVKGKQKKTFEDVAGQEEAKEMLLEIVDFLHYPERYAKIGANLPKGALLVGPPGTGKTLLAQAVAGEADVPFISISGSSFVEMFVGLAAKRVRDLFKEAQEKAPCIIFIDEIDAIGKSREASFSSNDEREQALNQLLTEMDGFDSKKGIVILAATNRPEVLDPALLRPGRFDRRIPVELPDLNGRIAVLKVHSKNIKMADDVDFKKIGLLTAGASGADLANIVNEAALRAVRNKRDYVIQEDLQESVEVVIVGYQRKTMIISKKEREMISYHEVGHAIVAAVQKKSAPVEKITIIPRTSGALGYTLQSDTEEKFLMDKEELFNMMVTASGGRAAEEIVFGEITTGASNDIEQITNIARNMVMRYGMSDDFPMMSLMSEGSRYLGGRGELTASEETFAKVDSIVKKLIADAYEKAKEILRENRTKLDSISKFLIEKETISGEEFMKIFNESDAKEAEENSDSEEPISTEENTNSDEPINTEEDTNSDEPINTEEKTKDDEASKTENIDDTNEEYKE
ncbi:ATP-dependent zinc metalloprotease FtsH [Fenollaria sporofastidiosus]|uniref:ATP-dependent zinc metalloprotease FtsH n=1 Tax=Fenollaria sporofastidiosus TaxID=2811778 RepID=UPI001BFFFB0A|nr:ATP-dependent zinc metalloprotease FtsH [Fenollaria sporofastidiosus]